MSNEYPYNKIIIKFCMSLLPMMQNVFTFPGRILSMKLGTVKFKIDCACTVRLFVFLFLLSYFVEYQMY